MLRTPSESSPYRKLLALGTALGFAPSAFAADAPPRTEADILKSVKLPDGYAATVFAMPPQLGYPTSVSAAIDGTIFVAVDENGSIDREPKRGRVVRMRDTDGDGRADEFKVFAEMDSPRGVIWDGPSGTSPGTLYVMHPPNLTAYTDADGDGVAEKQEDIVTALGFDLKFRGADHTTNGCRLGIDGFIYLAVGDYGFIDATARDGTKLTMRGGGIVRVRPDGTGFEIVSRGQRNIYDVAISPTLDLFTRDNTNDGGGWDVRLSFVPPGAHLGYPTLFKNFPEDMVQPLADYGGGSPCGALWIDEPGLQNGLYTVEWGRNAIMYHPLTPKGAGFEAQQVEWLKMTRPTDVDVDASGAIFITSWEGATFTYNGPNAGYVLRVVKKDKPKVEVPDFGKADALKLATLVFSDSATLRVASKAEWLRRINTPEHVKELWLVLSQAAPNELSEAQASSMIAFVFDATRKFGQLPVKWTTDVLRDEAKSPPWMRRAALHALSNGASLAREFSTTELRSFLSDSAAQVRAAAITALRRLGKTDAAPSIVPLVADPDPVISNLAVRALSELKPVGLLLDTLDSSDEKPKPCALRALYGIYSPEVVDGLILRLKGSQGELRRGILDALCRLANQDAPYTDPKMWWGTRPDTSGPVYQPVRWGESEKIEAALKAALDASNEDDARWLVQRMVQTKVNFPGLIELLLSKAGRDTTAKLTAIDGLFKSNNELPAEALRASQAIALDEKESPDFRARALRQLARASEHGSAFESAVAAFAPLAGHDIGQPALASVFEDFTRDAKQTKWIRDLEKLATSADAPKRTLAQTILVNLATSTLIKDKPREAALATVEKCWAAPETAASLLSVIARTKAGAFGEQVRAHLKDPNNTVAEAALFAFQSLGLSSTATPMKTIGEIKPEMAALLASKEKGDADAGKETFLKAACIACHTTSANEPPKGPILSAAAKIYDRAALAESILKPNAKIAQGFESQWFDTQSGEHVEGFVTREGGDSLDVRNVLGQTVTIEKAGIKERGKRDISMMPEGLMNPFTPADLANLLAYLESLKSQ